MCIYIYCKHVLSEMFVCVFLFVGGGRGWSVVAEGGRGAVHQYWPNIDSISKVLIKTHFFQKGISLFHKKVLAATCSPADRAWGPQNTPFQKRRALKKNACSCLFSRKQLLGVPIHKKRLSILISIDY